MSQDVRRVSNVTDLTLALYEDKAILKVDGALSVSLYHGCKNLQRLVLLTILLILCGTFSWLFPSVLIPTAIICAGLMILLALPLFYLRLSQISWRALRRVKRRYQVESFDGHKPELILKNRFKQFEPERHSSHHCHVRSKHAHAQALLARPTIPAS